LSLLETVDQSGKVVLGAVPRIEQSHRRHGTSGSE
jgi:hypothetical protein